MMDENEYSLIIKRKQWIPSLLEKAFYSGNRQAVKEAYEHDKLRFMHDILENLEFRYPEIHKFWGGREILRIQADIYNFLLDEYLVDSEFLLVWMIMHKINIRYIRLSEKIDRSILKTLADIEYGSLSADAKLILGIVLFDAFTEKNNFTETKIIQPCCFTCIHSESERGNLYCNRIRLYQEGIAEHNLKVQLNNLCDLWELHND